MNCRIWFVPSRLSNITGTQSIKGRGRKETFHSLLPSLDTLHAFDGQLGTSPSAVYHFQYTNSTHLVSTDRRFLRICSSCRRSGDTGVLSVCTKQSPFCQRTNLKAEKASDFFSREQIWQSKGSRMNSLIEAKTDTKKETKQTRKYNMSSLTHKCIKWLN